MLSTYKGIPRWFCVLNFALPLQRAQVWFLAGVLRSCMLPMARPNKKGKRKTLRAKRSLTQDSMYSTIPLYKVLKQLIYRKKISKQWLPVGGVTEINWERAWGKFVVWWSISWKESYTGVYIFPNSADVYLMFVHFTESKFCLKYCKQISNFI